MTVSPDCTSVLDSVTVASVVPSLHVLLTPAALTVSGMSAGLRASSRPPLRSPVPEIVAVPLPVTPAVGLSFQAAPTELADDCRSRSSVRAPGEVVVHPENVGALADTMPSMTTAAFALAVVIPVAVTVFDEPFTRMAPGVTSNGVLELTPENATMPPAALSVPAPSANV